jgi:hypothetical protein
MKFKISVDVCRYSNRIAIFVFIQFTFLNIQMYVHNHQRTKNLVFGTFIVHPFRDAGVSIPAIV